MDALMPTKQQQDMLTLTHPDTLRGLAERGQSPGLNRVFDSVS
jgi:hypothetical protein